MSWDCNTGKGDIKMKAGHEHELTSPRFAGKVRHPGHSGAAPSAHMRGGGGVITPQWGTLGLVTLYAERCARKDVPTCLPCTTVLPAVRMGVWC